MNEKPLERLNYYNGQRLEASDFKTEQDYHIRTRRWLNKSLYSAGIARGLEVRAVPESPSVIVSPGLAIDNEGREIILFEEVVLEVCSNVGARESTVAGNYLVIEYAEATIAYEKGGCAVRATGTSANKSTTNWGGPSRIQAQVKFSWVPFVPNPGSGQVVLARVELKDCTSVQQIDAGTRHYIGATVRQYALEGEREVAFIPKVSFPAPKVGETDTRLDVEVVGRIYFHVRGRQASSVTLHLRAERFSQLHYTELPYHRHEGSASGNTGNANQPITMAMTGHFHGVTSRDTNVENVEGHNHSMVALRNGLGEDHHSLEFQMNIREANRNEVRYVLSNAAGTIYGGSHLHRIEAFNTGNYDGFAYDHTHHFSDSALNIAKTGVVDLVNVARTGNILTFVKDLQISIGPAGHEASLIPFTEEIKLQLANTYPANWSVGGAPKSLGNGSGTHELATNGTGAIRLDHLQGMTFAEGEYCIVLKVDAKTEAGIRIANGGKIHYNLYIE